MYDREESLQRNKKPVHYCSQVLFKYFESSKTRGTRTSSWQYSLVEIVQALALAALRRDVLEKRDNLVVVQVRKHALGGALLGSVLRSDVVFELREERCQISANKAPLLWPPLELIIVVDDERQETAL